jgi:hypothetical protein
MHEIGFALEVDVLPTEGKVDVASLGAIEILRLNASTNFSVLAMRTLSSAKVFSSSGYLGTSLPANRAGALLAKSEVS